MGIECLQCGQGIMKVRSGTYRFNPPSNIPGGVIEITDAEWRECTECGEQIIDRKLSRQLTDITRRRRGLLSPDEIKDIRLRTGLSAEDMASLLGIGSKTYTRWETGKSIQNKSNDNLIRLVDRNYGVFAELEAERQPDRDSMIAEYIGSLCDLKGENRNAMAAHGAELPERIVEKLCNKLREIDKFNRRRELESDGI